MGVLESFTVLFLLVAGFILGFLPLYLGRSQEDSQRSKLKKENHDLRRNLQTSQVALNSLEEKFGRQRGQLNVLQQLCDDWSSSRETSERERAQLEVDLSAKSSRMSEIENEHRDEKRKRIELEDQIHKLSQEALAVKATVEEEWRNKHAEAEMALNKQVVDLETIKTDRDHFTKQLHDANAYIAELKSEISSSKNLIETATANASGLKQEYVSLESGLKSTNDQLKRARANIAKAKSEKQAADKATAESEKRVAVLEKEAESLREQIGTLQQKLESTQSSLTAAERQMARLTEQRDQSMELEKATGVVASGLQKRLDNQESTIHILRQSQDDALENLKHELKIRTELESKFDSRTQTVREESEKMRADYEAQITKLMEDKETEFAALQEDAKAHKTKLAEETETRVSAIENDALSQVCKLEDQSKAMAASHEAQLAKLEDQSKAMKASHEAQLARLREDAEAVQRDHDSKHATQVKELREQLSRQAAQYAEHSRDLRAQLAERRKELDAERQRLNSESQAMATQLSSAKSQLTNRIVELETDSTTYTESIVKLDAKREQLQHELEMARQQMQAQLKQDSETIGELQRERNDLRTELEQLHASIVPLQEQLDSHHAFNTELELSNARIVDLERSLVQRDQEAKRLHAQANELERLRQRYQEAKDRQESLQAQIDEMVSRQITRESERSNDMIRIQELEAQLKASIETIDDLRKERAMVLATLAEKHQAQEPQATIISFTQSMDEVVEEDDEYDQEYGGRMRRDANRGLVFTEAPETSDDLKRISGIAEVLEKRLNDFGIYTFRQVMEWKPGEIEEFSRLLAFRDRIVRDDWQGQARFFYNQKRKGVRSVA